VEFPTSFANVNDHILQLLPWPCIKMAYFLVPSNNNKTQYPTNCAPEPSYDNTSSFTQGNCQKFTFILKLKHWTGALSVKCFARDSGHGMCKMFYVDPNVLICDSVVKCSSTERMTLKVF